MPGIAGSAQIIHSGVLPGDPPALVCGWPAGSAAVWLAAATQPSASPHSAAWLKPASPWRPSRLAERA